MAENTIDTTLTLGQLMDRLEALVAFGGADLKEVVCVNIYPGEGQEEMTGDVKGALLDISGPVFLEVQVVH